MSNWTLRNRNDQHDRVVDGDIYENNGLFFLNRSTCRISRKLASSGESFAVPTLDGATYRDVAETIHRKAIPILAFLSTIRDAFRLLIILIMTSPICSVIRSLNYLKLSYRTEYGNHS